ncbi:hypothetical protein [Caenimonas aquaedulcis]|uniref:Uncharacterized protein n=1 Tax=Caenimonas aquaedulcis TaxID=2793270 RepID=A0A931MHA8_9BURK|nr:hypothetical protein [Caenimonas aquaedulcis]MBG9388025.1 hypothetical protein [Caenimonas aquaedulcis]
MNNDWGQLLGALAAGLRAQVAPHLATEQARIQLHAVIYALGNLQLQGGWSSAQLLQHVQAQRQFAGTVKTLLPDAAPLFAASEADNLDVAQSRDRGDAAINALIDRLYGVPAAKRDAAWQAARQALSDHLRATLAIDRQRTAKSMMHELSGPGSEQLA